MNSVEIPKAYEPGAVEERWSRFWEEKALFRADPASGEQPFCIVMPPPNITGSLHMGHALTNTLQDVVVRWRRMQGWNTLWLPGTDHAGIATQNVIERRLALEGRHRKDVGRVEFERIAWEWKEKAEQTIHHQLRRMGYSCDWTRVAFTMDPRMSRAVREVFVRLHSEGLIYRGEYMVNWCPRCTTAISDLEAQHEPHQGRLYHIRYPLSGGGHVTVATTRPETMLGDTAVAVHPEDGRYRSLVGRKLRLPLVEREIPLLADAAVSMEFGTGAVKVTPAHDPNDYQIALRHQLPFVQVIGEDGLMTAAAGAYAGMAREQARRRIVEDLAGRDLLAGEEPHQSSVARCQRCGTVVEPLVSRQWFVKIEALARPALEAVEQGRIRFIPPGYEKVYFEWMRNIHDWCISRQLWWGHRIPAWYCGACGETLVERTDPEACGRCGGRDLQQDPDVLDTWFSSALWPFSTLGWPGKTRDLEVYYPNTVMMTGFDIIFFWVARMIMMGIHFMGDVPFRTVFLNGLVRNEQRQKMSKSKGNAVDPLEMVEAYGTDAVRFTLAVMTGAGSDIVFSTDRMIGYRAFANKIWNAVRFALLNLPPGAGAVPHQEVEALVRRGGLSTPNRWILHRLNAAAAAVNGDLSRYRFDEAGNAVYRFFWHELCDWYLELSKPVLARTEDPHYSSTVRIMVYVLDASLRLLHPFMPFITEELWQRLPHQGLSVCVAPYPVPCVELEDGAAEAEMDAVTDLVTAVRTVRTENRLDPGRRLPLLLALADPALDSKLEPYQAAIRSLARLSEVRPVSALPQEDGGLRGFCRLGEFLLLAGQGVDVAGELERLHREVQKLRIEIGRNDSKLASDDFLRKAPPPVVEQVRARRQELAERLSQAEAEVERLQAAGSRGA